MTRSAQSNISRRDFLRSASLVFAGGLLAACGPSTPIAPTGEADGSAAGQPAAPVASSPNAVQWWVGWGELVPMFDSFKQMPKYKELMGDIDVEMKPSIADEALCTSLAAGTPPDIASNVSYLDLFSRDVSLDVST